MDYLKQIVEVGGFNRYAYEGVAPHLAVQQRVARLATKEPELELESTDASEPESVEPETNQVP